MIFVQFRSKIIRFLYYVHSFLIKLYLYTLTSILKPRNSSICYIHSCWLRSFAIIIQIFFNRDLIIIIPSHLNSNSTRPTVSFRCDKLKRAKTSLSAFTRTRQIIRFIFLYFRWTRSSPLSASNFLRRHEIRFHHRIAALNRFSTLLLSTLLHPVKIRYRFDSYLS